MHHVDEAIGQQALVDPCDADSCVRIEGFGVSAWVIMPAQKGMCSGPPGMLRCSPTQHMPPICTMLQVLLDMQQAVRLEDISELLPTKRAEMPCRGQACASDFTAARVRKKFQWTPYSPTGC